MGSTLPIGGCEGDGRRLTIEAGAHFEGDARRTNQSMKAEAWNLREAELAAETKLPEPVADTPFEVEEPAYAGDPSAIEP
jgi:hypothetical protein